jgi:type I restriction enzyme M protein
LDNQRAFNRKEFLDRLSDCHGILRDVHKMDPGRSFDTISKILLIKMHIERSEPRGALTTEFLDKLTLARSPGDPAIHEGLFERTKKHCDADDLFDAAETLGISEDTFRRLVQKLERFDLSKTGGDIEGLAFERFLGATFRGELGQFFTPRPVVDFMVGLLNPREGELVCDPASGSGGFLIRFFEHVRSAIASDIQKRKDGERGRVEALELEADEKARRIEAAFSLLDRELLPTDGNNRPLDTRVGRLARRCVLGADAEPRAARTAKMNMIMRGGGHGGIHHHDGLVDIGGIFDGRFDLVLTNPPFGSKVGKDQKVGGSWETRIPADDAHMDRCRNERSYGASWEESRDRMLRAAKSKTPILDLFEIGRGKNSRPAELIFVERCLNLLKPGGRMGIVLPDGNLNNPSLAWFRRWVEGKARLLAVVGLPEDAFHFSKATVKASMVFLRKFSEAEAALWESAWARARSELDPEFDRRRDEAHAAYEPLTTGGGDPAAVRLLGELDALGLRRKLPRWRCGQPPQYPPQCRPTLQGKPVWIGRVAKAGQKEAAELKKRAAAVLASSSNRDEALLSELKSRYKTIDEAHTAGLWAHVRQSFDYPIFIAAPKTVGITSAGETGDGVANELPDLLAAYRAFEDWSARGEPEPAPNFHRPSTS